MVNTKRTLQTKLFAGFVLITLFAIAVPAFLSRSALYDNYLNHVTEHSFEQTAIIKSILETNPTPEQLQALLKSSEQNGNRLTIINSKGTTLFDSHVDRQALADMDNHNDRPEVEEARSKGKGVSTRYSNTLSIDSVYTAVTFGDGKIIRLALPLADVHLSFATHLSTLSIIFVIATIICLAMSVFITQRVRKGVDSMAEVVAEIATNKGGRRLTRVPGKEFLPLAHAVNHMAESIEKYVETTTDQRSQLEIILDSVHEGILVLSPTGAIRRYNKALAELFPAVEGAKEKQVIEAIPIPDLQHKVEEFLENTRKDENQANVDPLHFEYGGKFLVTHLSQPVLASQSNQSVGAVLVIYNATTIMRLERVRRDFIANISHELRTPLTAISGYAETLLSMDNLNDDQRKFSAIIYKHANGLAKVIHDLLALTRIEKADDSIVLEPVSPFLPCQEAIKLCSEQAAQKNIRFSLHMPGLEGDVVANSETGEVNYLPTFKNDSGSENQGHENTQGGKVNKDSGGNKGSAHILDIRHESSEFKERDSAFGETHAFGRSGRRGESAKPGKPNGPNLYDAFGGSSITATPRIMGNAPMLTQVFRNLLENACRYSPEDGTIVISAHVANNEMVFAIKDQGPGIAQSELPQIFERLYQVNKERNSGSSGIGLAICKHIIRLHKGVIWAESPYENYATAMLFTLPLEEPLT